MNQLEALYAVTKELADLLNEPIPSEQREVIINQINDLITERSIHLKEINPPYTTEENIIGKRVITLNKHIQNKMNLLFGEIKLEMKNVKYQRKSNRSYTNPFKDVQSMDGTFMDSKK